MLSICANLEQSWLSTYLSETICRSRVRCRSSSACFRTKRRAQPTLSGHDGVTFVCPHCDTSGEPYRYSTRPGVLCCRHCRRETRLAVGTVMERTHTPLLVWFWAGVVWLPDRCPGTSIITDDWSSYVALWKRGYLHTAALREGNCCVAETFLPIIHLVFSHLKTWLRGIHHGVSPQHLAAGASAGRRADEDVTVLRIRPQTPSKKRLDGLWGVLCRTRSCIAALCKKTPLLLPERLAAHTDLSTRSGDGNTAPGCSSCVE